MLPPCKSFVRARLLFVAKSLIVKTKLLPKDLKPLRVAVFILSVFLVGCASTRQTSTQSYASDVIGQPEIGIVLSLTDLHFNPFYDPKLFQALVQSAPSEWTRIFDGSQISGYGQYGKDSNYNLFVSALQHAALAAPRAEVILLAGDETGRSSAFLLVTPGISPLFGNNPGLQVLSYDRKAFSLLDYSTHRLDLAAGPLAQWREEYRFSRAYRLFPVTDTTLNALSRSLKEEAQPRATYIDYYNVGNPAIPQITDPTWPLYWCSIEHLTAAPFQTCVENFSRP
jgi:hypothetical protein